MGADNAPAPQGRPPSDSALTDDVAVQQLAQEGHGLVLAGGGVHLELRGDVRTDLGGREGLGQEVPDAATGAPQAEVLTLFDAHHDGLAVHVGPDQVGVALESRAQVDVVHAGSSSGSPRASRYPKRRIMGAWSAMIRATCSGVRVSRHPPASPRRKKVDAWNGRSAKPFSCSWSLSS